MKFVLLVLLARIVNWTTGCGPADGQLGGKCLSDGSGCSRDGKCNQGHCDESSNTCEESAAPIVPSTPPPEPPVQTCDFGELGDCPGDELAVLCNANEPFPSGVHACLLMFPPEVDAGRIQYCCEPDDRTGSNDASSFFAPFIDE